MGDIKAPLQKEKAKKTKDQKCTSRAIRALSMTTGQLTERYLKKNAGKVLGGTRLEQVSPEMFVAHQTPPNYIDRHVIFSNPRHLEENYNGVMP